MTELPSAYGDTFCRDLLPPVTQQPILTSIEGVGHLNAAVELLDRTIAVHGADRPAVRSKDLCWTYGDLQKRVLALSAILVESWGLRAGNRVVLHGVNSPILLAAWLAVLRVGGVVVATPPLLKARELAPILDKARPTYVLCDASSKQEFELAGVTEDRIHALDTAVSEILEENVESGQIAAPPVCPTLADDVAIIAFTSGTTGVPKGAMHFHRDLLTIADRYAAQVVRLDKNDIVVGSPPIAFTFGLGALFIFPLRVGACTVLEAPCPPTALLDRVAEHRATVLFTAPTAYRTFLKSGQSEKLSTVRICVSAGEPLDARLWHSFESATGIRILDGLGSTEMLHIFVSNTPEDLTPGCLGHAVDGYVLETHDDAGKPTPRGVAGRLAVRGPIGCRYLDDARQTDTVRNGWNYTGDLARIDKVGRIWFVSRSDEMIVSAGHNISAAEVENVLLEESEVAECAVVGLSDAARGQIVTAYIVVGPGITPSQELVGQLKKSVKDKIAPYKYPRRIVFVESLPKTPTGKLRRRDLGALEHTSGQLCE
ncbi:AMP-binding protein [Nocardia asteroides]|uniref:AMP-binding protein n=1 Tax=Nocardia asteroides TaxID=1824 RepID=UPI003431D512